MDTSDASKTTKSAHNLTAVEDEDDQIAARTIMAEVGGDHKEFDGEETTNHDVMDELTPIEQYALHFVQRENLHRQVLFEREVQARETRKLRENERKMKEKRDEPKARPQQPKRQRSERIDTKQKLEKAKENEKKRQRQPSQTVESEDEEVYVPKKRGAVKNSSPRRVNGTKDGIKKGRGRPRKEDQMKTVTTEVQVIANAHTIHINQMPCSISEPDW